MEPTKKRGRPAKAKTVKAIEETLKEVVKVMAPTINKGLKSPYVFSFNIGGIIFKGEGTTPLEALRAVPRPEKIMAKGVLTITHGEEKKEMLFMVPRLKRLFYFNAQPILIKWIAQGLK
jgi:hypothetical protein